MPGVLPRISTVVEVPIYKALEKLAKRDGVSLSQKARDLLLEALELFEDETLESIALARSKNKAHLISHHDFWSKRGIK
jgi:hypothetical protein